MYMTLQNVKCKDMNNLHHILNILFFSFVCLQYHTHAHHHILNLSSVHLLSHESLIKKKKRNELYTLTTMKMRLKNNWNDKILLESSYRKSKFNTHHFKQIIIT